MKDILFEDIPDQYEVILKASKEIDFNMPSDLQTGSLLKTLVSSKSSPRILELGTGTGLATSWLLAGMDINSELITIENDAYLMQIAKRYLVDNRIRFVQEDGYRWLLSSNGQKQFDIIFADAMPGKYDLFENAWLLLKENGFYIVDDMLPQPNWPEGHAERVNEFIEMIESNPNAVITKMNWSTGIIIAVKRNAVN